MENIVAESLSPVDYTSTAQDRLRERMRGSIEEIRATLEEIQNNLLN